MSFAWAAAHSLLLLGALCGSMCSVWLPLGLLLLLFLLFRHCRCCAIQFLLPLGIFVGFAVGLGSTGFWFVFFCGWLGIIFRRALSLVSSARILFTRCRVIFLRIGNFLRAVENLDSAIDTDCALLVCMAIFIHTCTSIFLRCVRSSFVGPHLARPIAPLAAPAATKFSFLYFHSHLQHIYIYASTLTYRTHSGFIVYTVIYSHRIYVYTHTQSHTYTILYINFFLIPKIFICSLCCGWWLQFCRGPLPDPLEQWTAVLNVHGTNETAHIITSRACSAPKHDDRTQVLADSRELAT